MCTVREWWIETSWWASGIFATGAAWYFLSAGQIALTAVAAAIAIGLAGLAIHFRRTKDEERCEVVGLKEYQQVQNVIQKKVVTSEWWKSSALRADYENRGLADFRWSNSDRVSDREREGFEVVFESCCDSNVIHQIVNRSGQVLLARTSVA